MIWALWILVGISTISMFFIYGVRAERTEGSLAAIQKMLADGEVKSETLETLQSIHVAVVDSNNGEKVLKEIDRAVIALEAIDRSVTSIDDTLTSIDDTLTSIDLQLGLSDLSLKSMDEKLGTLESIDAGITSIDMKE